MSLREKVAAAMRQRENDTDDFEMLHPSDRAEYLSHAEAAIEAIATDRAELLAVLREFVEWWPGGPPFVALERARAILAREQ